MTVEELVQVMRHRLRDMPLTDDGPEVNMWLDCLQALEMLAGIPQPTIATQTASSRWVTSTEGGHSITYEDSWNESAPAKESGASPTPEPTSPHFNSSEEPGKRLQELRDSGMPLIRTAWGAMSPGSSSTSKHEASAPAQAEGGPAGGAEWHEWVAEGGRVWNWTTADPSFVARDQVEALRLAVYLNKHQVSNSMQQTPEVSRG